jgi:hypothetical protein
VVKKFLKKLLKIVGVLVLFIVIGIPGWIVLNSRDLAEAGDADLLIERPPPADEANALSALERAVTLLDLTGEDSSRIEVICFEETEDLAFAQALLARNAAALAEVERALALSRIGLSRHDVESEDATFPLEWMGLARLLALRSSARMAAGDQDGALEDALRPLQLGKMVEGAHRGGLFQTMLGIGFKRAGLRQVRSLLAHIQLDAERARELGTRLEALRLDPGDWVGAWAWEYQRVEAMLDRKEAGGEIFFNIENGPPGASWLERPAYERYFYHPNRTRAVFAEIARENQRSARRLCSDLAQVADPFRSPFGKLGILLGPNLSGEILVAESMLGGPKWQFVRCSAETYISALQTIAALRAWRDKHGDLPDTLDTLVPEYLAAIPLDAFDGKPLRYSAARHALWSVGDDLVDAGGGDSDAPRNLSEPTFSIPF